MTRPARVTLDLAALLHNLTQVRRHAPGARVVAVVKANAYGHGAVVCGQTLAAAGVDALGVACLDEALELRQAGISSPILLLEGVFSYSEMQAVIQHQLDVVVHSDEQIAFLQQALATAAASGWHPRVWLKVETGMHRLGFLPEQVAPVLQRLRALPGGAFWPVVMMSHLANAGNRDDDYTRTQAQAFDAVCAPLPPGMDRSLANSAAVLLWPDTHHQWVRPGIMLYGISPVPEYSAAHFDLRPVMTVTSEIIEIKHCRKGDTVGYNRTWTCPEDMMVGVVAFGYGDGYPRHTRELTPVWINGALVPLIGVISMDMLTVDLRTQPGARIGDAVELWGTHLPVETIAGCAGTIPYELVCRITRRVQVMPRGDSAVAAPQI